DLARVRVPEVFDIARHPAATRKVRKPHSGATNKLGHLMGSIMTDNLLKLAITDSFLPDLTWQPFAGVLKDLRFCAVHYLATSAIQINISPGRGQVLNSAGKTTPVREGTLV